ncbi:MAG: FAD binding domain-containing protein [Vicinamibacterales bacterium]
MKAFAYVNAASEREALAALDTERGRVLPLAGGMDLVGLMKNYVAQPDRVVNIKNLDRAIAVSASGARIGAAATLAEIVEHAALSKAYPALVTAAEDVGTPQIRNAGTIGGNIVQRPRCWYFRNEEFHCLKKGGPRCFAVDGENQYHAIFGGGPCHIVHPSSLAVPLIAYGARFRVIGSGGEREVDAGEFFQLPADNLMGETVLRPNELLTHVMLPSPATVKAATYEVRFKQSHDWPLAIASAALTMEGDRVRSARVVMGAVAPIPWRVPSAEQALAGRTITEAVATEAAGAAVAGATAMSQNGYKIQVARTAVKRAILRAAGIRTV